MVLLSRKRPMDRSAKSQAKRVKRSHPEIQTQTPPLSTTTPDDSDSVSIRPSSSGKKIRSGDRPDRSSHQDSLNAIFSSDMVQSSPVKKRLSGKETRPNTKTRADTRLESPPRVERRKKQIMEVQAGVLDLEASQHDYDADPDHSEEDHVVNPWGQVGYRGRGSAPASHERIRELAVRFCVSQILTGKAGPNSTPWPERDTEQWLGTIIIAAWRVTREACPRRLRNSILEEPEHWEARLMRDRFSHDRSHVMEQTRRLVTEWNVWDRAKKIEQHVALALQMQDNDRYLCENWEDSTRFFLSPLIPKLLAETFYGERKSLRYAKMEALKHLYRPLPPALVIYAGVCIHHCIREHTSSTYQGNAKAVYEFDGGHVEAAWRRIWSAWDDQAEDRKERILKIILRRIDVLTNHETHKITTAPIDNAHAYTLDDLPGTDDSDYENDDTPPIVQEVFDDEQAENEQACDDDLRGGESSHNNTDISAVNDTAQGDAGDSAAEDDVELPSNQALESSTMRKTRGSSAASVSGTNKNEAARLKKIKVSISQFGKKLKVMHLSRDIALDVFCEDIDLADGEQLIWDDVGTDGESGRNIDLADFDNNDDWKRAMQCQALKLIRRG